MCIELAFPTAKAAHKISRYLRPPRRKSDNRILRNKRDNSKRDIVRADFAVRMGNYRACRRRKRREPKRNVTMGACRTACDLRAVLACRIHFRRRYVRGVSNSLQPPPYLLFSASGVCFDYGRNDSRNYIYSQSNSIKRKQYIYAQHKTPRHCDTAFLLALFILHLTNIEAGKELLQAGGIDRCGSEDLFANQIHLVVNIELGFQLAHSAALRF